MIRIISMLAVLASLCALPAQADGPFGAQGAQAAEAAGTPNQRPVVAVVLSGGAALGFAHVGVLKVIQEMGIPVDIVVGTSMGAIVGGMYAAGYSPADMERITSEVDWQAGFDDVLADSPYGFREREVSRRFPFTIGFDAGGFWAGRGLLGGQPITTLLEMLTLNVSGIDDFDQLPRRFRAVAADIVTGEQVVLAHGRLADAMRASATIPLLFKPFVLDGRALVDGGIVNRLPTDVAREMGADIVIAVDVIESPARSAEELRTMVDMLGRVSSVLVEQNTAARRALADLVIRPDLSGFRRLDFPRAARIIQRGEETARRSSKELEEIARRIVETRPLDAQAGAGPYLTSAPPPSPQTLAIQGASPENEQLARRIFSPLLRGPLDPRVLQAAVNEAYQSGRFEEIRVGLAPSGEGRTGLVVNTVPLLPAKGAALLGLSYQGDLSQTLVNSLVITPGIIVRDVTGKGSQLIVAAHLVDTLGAELEYFQPLGRSLFFDGYANYVLDKDVYLQGDSAQVGRLDRGPTAGAWTGFLLGQTGEVKAGFAWNARHYIDPALPAAVDSTAAIARFLFAVDTRPAAVFPARGFGIGLGYDEALPVLGGGDAYKKLSIDAEAEIPLLNSLTLGLTFSGGTDLTLAATAPGALGPADAFSLRTATQFRGYQEWEVRGSHKLAGGLDLQLRLPGLDRVIGTDFYLLGNLSAGNCWTDLSQITRDFSLHYGASLGLGVRIRRNFELATRVCYVDSGRLQLSVDVGPFAVDDVAGPLQ